MNELTYKYNINLLYDNDYDMLMNLNNYWL